MISLPDAVERRRNIRAQLARLCLTAEFFEGLDGPQGAALFERVDAERHVLNTGRYPSPGEVGCFASHRSLWRRCAAAGKPICILEDDCRLEANFAEALDVASRLTARYGFIRLQKETRAKKRLICLEGDFRLHRYTKMAHSTLAYVISPGVATRLVENSAVMDAPVDIYIKRFWRHGQPLFGLTPYAARESRLSGESHIGHRQRATKRVAVRFARTATKLRWFVRRTAFNITNGTTHPPTGDRR